MYESKVCDKSLVILKYNENYVKCIFPKLCKTANTSIQKSGNKTHIHKYRPI